MPGRETVRWTAICSFAFLLALGAGNAYSACENKCKELLCRTNTWQEDDETPDWPCRAFNSFNAPDPNGVISRDPPGGTRTSAMMGMSRYKCRDCNPECIIDSSEATDCFTATGPEFDSNCDYHSPITKHYCDQGTPM